LKKKPYLSIGCAFPETIDIQLSQAATGSLSHRVIGWCVSSPAYPGAIQANVFDGKYDGKSPSPFCLRNLPLESFPGGAKDYKFRQKRNWELPCLGNFGVLSPTFSHVATAGHARQTFIRSAQLSAFRCLGLPSQFEKMCCEGQLRTRPKRELYFQFQWRLCLAIV
jgi:hypothetical protein